MARWKLTEKHYLNVPGTKWEYHQVDRSTGRPIRKVYEVPLYLDPEDVTCCNRRDGFDEYIVVCHEGKGLPDGRDIVFLGDPTPGMLPLDDEAREITARFDWTPTQGTDEQSQQNSFQNKLLLGLIDQMSDAQTKATQAQSIPGLEQFMTAMAAMMQQQTEVLAKLAHPAVVVQPELPLGDPVVDDLDPLPAADEPTPEEIAASAEAHRAGEAAASKQASDRLGRIRR